VKGDRSKIYLFSLAKRLRPKKSKVSLLRAKSRQVNKLNFTTIHPYLYSPLTTYTHHHHHHSTTSNNAISILKIAFSVASPLATHSLAPRPPSANLPDALQYDLIRDAAHYLLPLLLVLFPDDRGQCAGELAIDAQDHAGAPGEIRQG